MINIQTESLHKNSVSVTKSRNEIVTVSVLASVCHRKKTRGGMLELAVAYATMSGYVSVQPGSPRTSSHQGSGHHRWTMGNKQMYDDSVRWTLTFPPVPSPRAKHRDQLKVFQRSSGRRKTD